jgi:hypothetical protein
MQTAMALVTTLLGPAPGSTTGTSTTLTETITSAVSSLATNPEIVQTVTTEIVPLLPGGGDANALDPCLRAPALCESGTPAPPPPPAGGLVIDPGDLVDFSAGAHPLFTSLTQTGGVLSGTDTVSFTAPSTWSGGVMGPGGGTAIGLGGSLDLTGAGTKDLVARTLSIFGTATWTGGRIRTGSGAQLFIAPATGVFDIRTDDVIANDLGGAPSVIDNFGLLQKTAGAGTAIVESNVQLDNAGTVEALSGTLEVRGPAVNQVTGLVLAGPGATLRLTGAAANAGTFVADGGTVAAPGLTNVAAGALTGGTYSAVGGTLRLGAQDILTNSATVVLDGPAAQLLRDDTGTDALALLAGNAPGGSFTITNGRNFTTVAPFSNLGALSVGPASALTVLTTFGNFGALALAPGGQLLVSNNAELRLDAAGTVSNAGIIAMQDVADAGPTVLRVTGPAVTLAGTGLLTLSNSSQNRVIGNAGGEQLVNDTGHTIRGAGLLGNASLAIDNRGSIEAAFGNALIVEPSGDGVANTGVVRALAGGQLLLDNAVVANAGGLIEAEIGGAVTLLDTAVQGGSVLVGVSSGLLTLSNATLAGVDLRNGSGGLIQTSTGTTNVFTGSGSFQNLGAGILRVADNSVLQLDGSLTYDNQAFIQMQDAANATPTDIRVVGNVQIAGGGTITMTASAGNRIVGASPTDVFTNVDNTIVGSGLIGAGQMVLANGGTIQAAAGPPLVIEPSAGGVDNFGTLEALAGGVLRLRNATIVQNPPGGGIRAHGPGVVELENVAITGGRFETPGGARSATSPRPRSPTSSSTAPSSASTARRPPSSAPSPTRPSCASPRRA